MKKQLALSLAFLTSAFLMGCGSSSSSSDDNSASSYDPKDCTLAEEGIKVLLPSGGEEFTLGDSVEIVFVANYANAGGFSVLYRANEEDKGKDLFPTSVGDDAPDGTSCTTVKALLSESLTASTEAFIFVKAYNAPKIRASSNTFTVKAK